LAAPLSTAPATLSDPPLSSPVFYACLIALALLHATLAAWSASVWSVTHDEYWHLPTGLFAWETGRLDIEVLNPPLVRIWTALPLHLAGVTSGLDAGHVGSNGIGDAFLSASGPSYHNYFLVARLFNIVLSVGGGLLLAGWINLHSGRAAAVLGMAFWAIEPNLLAAASLVTSDTGVTVGFVLVCYLLDRFAHRPNLWQATALGIGLGLALLTKFTALLLVPVALGGAGFLAFRNAQQASLLKRGLAAVRSVVASFLAMLILVNTCYQCSGVGAPVASLGWTSKAFAPLAKLPVWLPSPLPREYLQGVDQQRTIMESPHPVYLDGELSTQGQPAYYLKAWWYKTPHGLQALIALGVGLILLRRPAARSFWWMAGLAIPSAILLAIASQSGMQIGYRYVLPAIPLSLLIAAASWQLATSRPLRIAIVIAGVAYAASLRSAPETLGYFNEWAGGPREGRWLLIDSNIDWGQDLGRLQAWWKDAGQPPMKTAYFGTVPLASMGLPNDLPPRGEPQPGLYAISVNFLQGRPHAVRAGPTGTESIDIDAFGYFRFFEPKTIVGTSIYIFDLTPADIVRFQSARRAAGL
jgi:Dolichyl-phosphate-mannose-protein mannosyltransferase